MSLYFVAAESSGDLLAREVIDCIRQKSPQTRIDGIGGAELLSAGIHSPIDIAPLSVLGFVEGIKAYRKVVELADAAAADICRKRPKVLVLVDSWGFTLRVAQRVRVQDPSIRIVKLIGPQVWATRPGRAATLASTVDHLLGMHDIEVPYYEPFGLKVTVIGNPALTRTGKGNGASFRSAHGISPDGQVVLVLPGSRRSEIANVAPALLAAARRIKEKRPAVSVVVQPAEEGGAGGEAMVKDGWIPRFGIKEIYGMHNSPGRPVGHLLAYLLAQVGQVPGKTKAPGQTKASEKTRAPRSR
jgi:lipid-A-disaccharide synthase